MTVRGGGGFQSACSSPSPANWWRVLATTASHLQCGLQRAALKLRLVEHACSCWTVRRGGQLKMRARLRHQHSCGECLSPWSSDWSSTLVAARRCEAMAESACRRDQPPCSAVCNGATMKRRLLEQAYSCSTVHVDGGLQSACSSLPTASVRRVLAATTSHLQCGLQRSRHEAPIGHASSRLPVGARRWRTPGAR